MVRKRTSPVCFIWNLSPLWSYWPTKGELTSFLRMQESMHCFMVWKRTSPFYFIWNLSPLWSYWPTKGKLTSFLRMQESIHCFMVRKRTNLFYFIWNLFYPNYDRFPKIYFFRMFVSQKNKFREWRLLILEFYPHKST